MSLRCPQNARLKSEKYGPLLIWMSSKHLDGWHHVARTPGRMMIAFFTLGDQCLSILGGSQMCPRKSLAENKCLLLDGATWCEDTCLWRFWIPWGITWRTMRVEVLSGTYIQATPTWHGLLAYSPVLGRRAYCGEKTDLKLHPQGPPAHHSVSLCSAGPGPRSLASWTGEVDGEGQGCPLEQDRRSWPAPGRGLVWGLSQYFLGGWVSGIDRNPESWRHKVVSKVN